MYITSFINVITWLQCTWPTPLFRWHITCPCDGSNIKFIPISIKVAYSFTSTKTLQNDSPLELLWTDAFVLSIYSNLFWIYSHVQLLGKNAFWCKNHKSIAQTSIYSIYEIDVYVYYVFFMYVFTLYFHNVTFCNNSGYICNLMTKDLDCRDDAIKCACVFMFVCFDWFSICNNTIIKPLSLNNTQISNIGLIFITDIPGNDPMFIEEYIHLCL